MTHRFLPMLKKLLRFARAGLAVASMKGKLSVAGRRFDGYRRFHC
ncbi:hypothetical protein ACVXG9_26505 [Escherichia coli]